MRYDLSEIMRRLYASEINCGIESFWDAGFTIFLGDDMNGRKWENTVEAVHLASAGAILATAALAHYPKSAFAEWHKAKVRGC